MGGPKKNDAVPVGFPERTTKQHYMGLFPGRNPPTNDGLPVGFP